jgi:tetratricopeptide (TPR) repeat protein
MAGSGTATKVLPSGFQQPVQKLLFHRKGGLIVTNGPQGDWSCELLLEPKPADPSATPRTDQRVEQLKTDQWRSDFETYLLVAVSPHENSLFHLRERTTQTLDEGAVEEGLSFYQRAIAQEEGETLNADDLQFHIQVARSLVNRGRFIEAIDAARHASKADRYSGTESRDVLAHALFGARRYAEALEAWQFVERFDPQFFTRRSSCSDDRDKIAEARRQIEAMKQPK